MLKPVENTEFLTVARTATIREALHAINRNLRGIVIVLDDAKQVLATLTDGDLRRAILGGAKLDDGIEVALREKKNRPVTAPHTTGHAECLHILREHQIRQLPLVDEAGCFCGMVVLDDLIPKEVVPLQAVIMAGGYGKRLHPLTQDLPKPMLPVGDRPLMEHIVEQLRESGVHRINVSTHYMPDKIVEHFGDGSAFGVEIDYVSEESPLGTAGALGLLENVKETLLIINGDILTGVDFRAMREFHQEHNAVITVGVRQYDFQVPYGVIECDEWRVKRLHEKPVFHFFVNAGIYLVEPEALKHIPKNERCDMTDLIERLTKEGLPVASFPVVEYWLDIGRHSDYERAQEDLRSGVLSRK